MRYRFLFSSEKRLFIFFEVIKSKDNVLVQPTYFLQKKESHDPYIGQCL